MTNIGHRQMQSMLQKLSPQQIQMIKLLELPATMLEERIKQEIEENPVLDEVLSSDASGENQVKYNIDEYASGESNYSYKLSANNYSKDDKPKTVPLPESISFLEFLEGQIDFLDLNELELKVCRYLISDLDVDGYLRRSSQDISDDFEFKQNLEIPTEQIDKCVSVIQSLEPAGIGCRDLKESLLVQLSRREQTSLVKLAYKLLSNCFEEFAKKHYAKIMSKLALSESDLKAVIDLILTLTPKPANQYSGAMLYEGNIQIIPDFLLEEDNEGELELSLNHYNAPDIKINATYVKMLEDLMVRNKHKNGKAIRKGDDSEAATFIKQKMDSARWFISAIKQRDITLMLTMHAILEYQRDYFMSGEEAMLHPMILKDIATKTQLDVSTVSRVVNSKHIQTTYGIIPLKFFFSEAMQTDGGQDVSSREVKSILMDCVNNEDKMRPLTDEALMDVLKEKGYVIARRTVAKYREMLGIHVARLRKEIV